jgi:rieske iron-sulfur protein
LPGIADQIEYGGVGTMKAKFCKQRRDLLKGTATVACASAVVALGGGVKAFAQGDAQDKGVPIAGDPLIYLDGCKKGQEVAEADVVLNARALIVVAQDPSTGKPRENDGDTDKATVLLYRAAPDKIPATMSDGTVNGIVCYSDVCTHLGCMLTDWNAKNEPQCPCHDATFNLLNEGENTGGATCRPLPQIPIKAVNGKLVVAGKPTGYIGVKRGY